MTHDERTYVNCGFVGQTSDDTDRNPCDSHGPGWSCSHCPRPSDAQTKACPTCGVTSDGWEPDSIDDPTDVLRAIHGFLDASRWHAAFEVLVRWGKRRERDQNASVSSRDIHAEREERTDDPKHAELRANLEEMAPLWVVVAWLWDRREQYRPSSVTYAAFDELIRIASSRGHIEAWKHGELDDLRKVAERCIKARKRKPSPSSGDQKEGGGSQ